MTGVAEPFPSIAFNHLGISNTGKSQAPPRTMIETSSSPTARASRVGRMVTSPRPWRERRQDGRTHSARPSSAIQLAEYALVPSPTPRWLHGGGPFHRHGFEASRLLGCQKTDRH